MMAVLKNVLVFLLVCGSLVSGGAAFLRAGLHVVIKESSGTARPFCEALQQRGILAKETHEQVIRFVPPLVIEKTTLEWALPHIAEVVEGAAVAVG